MGNPRDPRAPDDPPPGWRAVGEVTSPSWMHVVQPEPDYDPWRERRTHAERRTGRPRPPWVGKLAEDADDRPLARRLGTYVEPRPPVNLVTPLSTAPRSMPRWMERMREKGSRR